MFAQSPPIVVPPGRGGQGNDVSQLESSDSSEDERRPLQQYPEMDGGNVRRYGSIVGTPPTSDTPGHLPNLALPDPALDPARSRPPTLRGESTRPATVSKPAETSSDAYHVGPQHKPPGSRKLSDIPKQMFHKDGAQSKSQQSKLKRVFASRPLDSPALPDVQLSAYKELDARQDEFFSFLDKELDKIEKFYKSKEEEANDRLDVLREQLHEMRDRRVADMHAAKRGGKVAENDLLDGQLAIMSSPSETRHNSHHHIDGQKIVEAGKGVVRQRGKIGKTSKAMKELSSPAGPTGKQNGNTGTSDYVRKPVNHDNVPYRFAKRRLKLALQEFYRGLELLKSYTLLNRTAFRKVNKKYDKAVNARPTLQYMSSKVNNAYFVQSSVVEGHLVAVEDLYARYFERGNHKVAVNKLRSRLRQGDQSATTFRNGAYVAAGACFGIAGLINAQPFLHTDDPVLNTHTSYLLQIYAGYFLALLLFLMYILDCRIWQRARVNYIFIFEFDTRHVLDWRQLAEIPCFFLFLNGLFIWLNFEFESAQRMFLYWPVILLGVTLILIFLPLKILYHNSRYWFAYSNWRLLLAGLYPVEFRDFFFGDMYCSETYTLSQISLFFCLYAHKWNDPAQCGSNHSMLLGFFTTLPAIWRALQCLRRYRDTRNWFPHLANFAKYLGNILYYMTLSLYRLKINDERRAVFIVFAIVNGVYCSVWDVLMDWSLGNPWAKHPFLRDHLAYRRVWVYYVAIVLDVLLRQQWVFYAIFTEDLQHSSIVSFCVGLAEVLRRGMWSVFRVENEHCNNVVQFRASRDVPLPYALPSSSSSSTSGKKHEKKSKGKHDDSSDDDRVTASPATPAAAGSGTGTAVDLERQRTDASGGTGASSIRQRKSPGTPMSALRRVGTVIATAHSQDFQKKKRPEVDDTPRVPFKNGKHESSDEDEDEDDDDTDEEGHHHHNSANISDVDEHGRPLSSPSDNQKQQQQQQQQQQKTNTSGQSRASVRFRKTSIPSADPTSSEVRQTVSGEANDDESDSDESPGGGDGESDTEEEEGEAERSSPPALDQVVSRSIDEGIDEEEAELDEIRDTISRARSPG